MQSPDEGVQGREVETQEASEVSVVVSSTIQWYSHLDVLSRLIFYEPVGKGGGLAAKSFDRISHFVSAAYDTVSACECEGGCDSCTIPHAVPLSIGSLTSIFSSSGILDPFCREHNTVLSKLGAKVILQGLLGLPVLQEDVPLPEHLPGDPVAHHQTIVEADAIPIQGNVQVERD